MMKKLRKLALSVALAAGSAPAFAAQPGFYAGIGFGQASTSDWVSEDDMLTLLDIAGVEAGVLAFSGNISSDSDDKDSGWKLYGGYQFNDNLAVEASYMDLGTATGDARASGDFLFSGGGTGSGSLFVGTDMEATALTIDGVGRLPVAPWLDLFAKLGMYRSDLELTVVVGASGAGGTASDSVKESDNSTGAHIAIGADFNVAPQVIIRAEWERLADVEFDDGETDIDMLSISAAYRF